jgi:Pectate lyase superfamily protein
MKTTLAIVLFWIVYVACGTLATAVCTGASVRTFGAKGDGQSDDTSAIQSAIDAAAASGGGSVVFNAARYFTTGSLTSTRCSTGLSSARPKRRDLCSPM